MMRNWIDGLVRFGVVKKAGIVNTDTDSYLFIHPAIDHEWPDKIELDIETLTRIADDKLPDEVKLLSSNAPVIYKISYKAAPEDLAVYLVDIDVALANRVLKYISDNIPENLVYPAFFGLFVNMAFRQVIPFFTPMWSVYKEGSE